MPLLSGDCVQIYKQIRVNPKYSNDYLISPQSRKGRKDNFSFHLPFRGPVEAGCKQRQMKNNQPSAHIGNKYSLRPLRLGGDKYYQNTLPYL
jgi:hypothetical protein